MAGNDGAPTLRSFVSEEKDEITNASTGARPALADVKTRHFEKAPGLLLSGNHGGVFSGWGLRRQGEDLPPRNHGRPDLDLIVTGHPPPHNGGPRATLGVHERLGHDAVMKTIRAVFIDLAAESDSVKRRFVKLDKRGKPPEIIEDRTLGPHSSWMLRKVTEDGDAIYHPA